MYRLALVTNIPAPYRIPVFNCLSGYPEIDLHVFYSAKTEPNRNWDLPKISFPHTFLKENFLSRPDARFMHINPDVFAALREFDPHLVLNTGFAPTHLCAFAYSKLYRRPHIAMTDGTVLSESDLSWVHRWIRKIVIGRSRALVAASEGGRALFRKYGAADVKIHISRLCANTAVPWQGVAPHISALDFLFSGRLVDIKNPMFALQVAHDVAQRIGRRTSLAVLGSGPLDSQLRKRAADLKEHVEVHIAGNVPQADVPRWFAGARVFLFPTTWDPWGVVANEAFTAGVPVIASPHAGAAGDLIRDGLNGYIRPIDLPQWVDAAAELLSNPGLHSRFSTQARLDVRSYSFENAAQGIVDAVKMAMAG